MPHPKTRLDGDGSTKSESRTAERTIDQPSFKEISTSPSTRASLPDDAEGTPPDNDAQRLIVMCATCWIRDWQVQPELQVGILTGVGCPCRERSQTGCLILVFLEFVAHRRLVELDVALFALEPNCRALVGFGRYGERLCRWGPACQLTLQRPTASWGVSRLFVFRAGCWDHRGLEPAASFSGGAPCLINKNMAVIHRSNCTPPQRLFL